jgi:hypothetical protein
MGQLFWHWTFETGSIVNSLNRQALGRKPLFLSLEQDMPEMLSILNILVASKRLSD